MLFSKQSLMTVCLSLLGIASSTTAIPNANNFLTDHQKDEAANVNSSRVNSSPLRASRELKRSSGKKGKKYAPPPSQCSDFDIDSILLINVNADVIKLSNDVGQRNSLEDLIVEEYNELASESCGEDVRFLNSAEISLGEDALATRTRRVLQQLSSAKSHHGRRLEASRPDPDVVISSNTKGDCNKCKDDKATQPDKSNRYLAFLEEMETAAAANKHASSSDHLRHRQTTEGKKHGERSGQVADTTMFGTSGKKQSSKSPAPDTLTDSAASGKKSSSKSPSGKPTSSGKKGEDSLKGKKGDSASAEPDSKGKKSSSEGSMKGKKGDSTTSGDSLKGKKVDSAPVEPDSKGKKSSSEGSMKGKKGDSTTSGDSLKGKKGDSAPAEPDSKGKKSSSEGSMKGKKGDSTTSGDSLKGKKGDSAPAEPDLKGKKSSSEGSMKGKKGDSTTSGDSLKGKKVDSAPVEPDSKGKKSSSEGSMKGKKGDSTTSGDSLKGKKVDSAPAEPDSKGKKSSSEGSMKGKKGDSTTSGDSLKGKKGDSAPAEPDLKGKKSSSEGSMKGKKGDSTTTAPSGKTSMGKKTSNDSPSGPSSSFTSPDEPSSGKSGTSSTSSVASSRGKGGKGKGAPEPEECCEPPTDVELSAALREALQEDPNAVPSVSNVGNIVELSPVDCSAEVTTLHGVITIEHEASQIKDHELDLLGEAFIDAYNQANSLNVDICDPSFRAVTDCTVHEPYVPPAGKGKTGKSGKSGKYGNRRYLEGKGKSGKYAPAPTPPSSSTVVLEYYYTAKCRGCEEGSKIFESTTAGRSLEKYGAASRKRAPVFAGDHRQLAEIVQAKCFCPPVPPAESRGPTTSDFFDIFADLFDFLRVDGDINYIETVGAVSEH